MGLSQKLANNKNPQFSSNHCEIWWLGKIASISAGLDKNCEFFYWLIFGEKRAVVNRIVPDV